MKADVCVIGAGAGGCTAASELARRGAKTVLLEAGCFLDFRKDFAPEQRDEDALPLAFFKESEACLPYASTPPSDLPEGFEELSSYCPSQPLAARARKREPARLKRAVAVGGSTLRFAACSDRWPPAAFAGTGLEQTDLTEWYAKAEARLKVHGAMPYHRYPAHEMRQAAKRLAPAFKRAGLSLRPASLAILVQKDPLTNREDCGRFNLCTVGCSTGAKSSYDLAMLAPALASHPQNLTVLARTLALRLVLARGDAKHVEALEYLDLSNSQHPEGLPGVINADKFVLAAGAVETPRLLLLSANRYHPDGLGNEHDLVGRNLCGPLFVQPLVLFDEPLSSQLGPAIEAMADTEIDGQPCQVSVSQDGFSRPLQYAEFFPPAPWGNARVGGIGKRFGRVVGISAETSQLPSPENRITLCEQADDPFKRPIAYVENANTAADLEWLVKLRNLAHRIAAESSGRLIGQFSAFDTHPGGGKLAGTCRLHQDPASGVVDLNLRVHGLENLYISDGSVLPSLCRGNPSLTIAALSLRLAEYLHTA